MGVDFEFPQRQLPSTADIFAALEGRLGKLQKLYFRQKDGKYVGIRLSESVTWTAIDCEGGVCIVRISDKSPPSSPTRPVVTPVPRGVPLPDQLAKRLAQLDISSDPGHLPMAQPVRPVDGQVSLEQLGVCFPIVGLDGLGDKLIEHIVKSWANFPKGEARNAAVLMTGGASGTGKTRFGAALPGVLLDAARRSSLPIPPLLIRALESCAARQLVLQFAELQDPNDTPTIIGMLLDSYAEPAATASTSRFSQPARVLRTADTLAAAFALIARTERAWPDPARPAADAIAVVIHIDEVQQLVTSGRYTEKAAATALGNLVRALSAAVWNRTSVGLFPIFYISGLSKTMVSLSGDLVIPVSLPLLTHQHYTTIIRGLFGFADAWSPPEPLVRALRCIEGPPRLLLVFLWAVLGAGIAPKKLFGEQIDCSLLRATLVHLSWDASVGALNRCMQALDRGRLITFTDNVTRGSGLLPLFNSLAALVLLSQPVSLSAQLTQGITVNDAIVLGFALAQPAEDPIPASPSPASPTENDDLKCRLFWPRMYIWAICKVFVFPPESFVSSFLSNSLSSGVDRALTACLCRPRGQPGLPRRA